MKSKWLKIHEEMLNMAIRFHLTPVRMTTSRAQTTTNVGKDVGKREPSYTAGRNVN
jgi:hypothetical protein